MLPELPEVETIRRTLIKLVLHKQIDRVSVFWPKMIKHPEEVEQFKDALIGQTIVQISRRGKLLIFIRMIMPLFPICGWKGGTLCFRRMIRSKSIHMSFFIFPTEQSCDIKMFVNLEQCICIKRN